RRRARHHRRIRHRTGRTCREGRLAMTTVRTAAYRVGRSMSASLVLGALVAGVPWCLTRFVGWPLPSQLPSWTEVTEALNGASISDATLIKTLACATWLVWTMLAICVLVEGCAWARGREAGRVPLGGLLQPIVRELVVSATLMVGTFRTSAPMNSQQRAVPV